MLRTAIPWNESEGLFHSFRSVNKSFLIGSAIKSFVLLRKYNSSQDVKHVWKGEQHLLVQIYHWSYVKWQCYGPLSELSLIRVIQQFLPSSFTLTELHTSLCNLSIDQAFIHTVHCNLPVFFSVHGVSTNSYRSWLTYVQSMDSQQSNYEFVLMTVKPV